MSGSRPMAPEKPLPGDCCESGCERCVFDVYAEELAHFENLMERWLERSGDREDFRA